MVPIQIFGLYLMDYIQTINTGIALHQVAKIDLFERSVGSDHSAATLRSVISEPEQAYLYKVNDIHGALQASAEVVEIAKLFEDRLGLSSENALDAAVRFIVLCMGTYPQEMGVRITGSVKASGDVEALMRFRALMVSAISNVIDGVEGDEYAALNVSIIDYAEILAGLVAEQRN